MRKVTADNSRLPPGVNLIPEHINDLLLLKPQLTSPKSTKAAAAWAKGETSVIGSEILEGETDKRFGRRPRRRFYFPDISVVSTIRMTLR